MKLLNKKLCAVLMLFGMASTVLGHNFTFKNQTNKKIEVAVYGTSSDHAESEIEPGKMHTFFLDNSCLHKVRVSIERTKWYGFGPGGLCENKAFSVTEEEDGIIVLKTMKHK